MVHAVCKSNLNNTKTSGPVAMCFDCEIALVLSDFLAFNVNSYGDKLILKFDGAVGATPVHFFILDDD